MAFAANAHSQRRQPWLSGTTTASWRLARTSHYVYSRGISLSPASIEKTVTTFNEGTALATFNDTDVTNSSAMPSNTLQEAHCVDVQLEGETSFRVRSQWGNGFPIERRIHLQLPGLYNVQNALAALTAATIAGINVETIIQSLEGFGGISRRFEIRNQAPIEVNGKRWMSS